MSAWLLQRPPRPGDRHERYLAGIDGQIVRTTTQALLARRFVSASAAHSFALQHEPHFEDWRIVKR